MLHMRGAPGMGPSPNALVLPERLKSMPLLTLGALEPHTHACLAPKPACLHCCRRPWPALHLQPPRHLSRIPPLAAGLTKVAALRGSGRDVNSDERIAVGHTVMAGSVWDLLRLVYPAAYPVHELAGAWGTGWWWCVCGVCGCVQEPGVGGLLF